MGESVIPISKYTHVTRYQCQKVPHRKWLEVSGHWLRRGNWRGILVVVWVGCILG